MGERVGGKLTLGKRKFEPGLAFQCTNNTAVFIRVVVWVVISVFSELDAHRVHTL